MRHVFDWHDLRDHALVSVTAGHLVTRLHATTHGEVDLDHFEHARRQLVAGGDLSLLGIKALIKVGALILELLGSRFEL